METTKLEKKEDIISKIYGELKKEFAKFEAESIATDVDKKRHDTHDIQFIRKKTDVDLFSGKNFDKVEEAIKETMERKNVENFARIINFQKIIIRVIERNNLTIEEMKKYSYELFDQNKQKENEELFKKIEKILEIREPKKLEV